MAPKGAGKVVPVSCKLCGNPTTTSPEDGEYFRCSRCLTLRTRYNYDGNQYGQKYSDNYIGYASTTINTPLNLFRLGLVSRWMRVTDNLLDIGCCIGEFIRFAEQHYKCTGFEPNDVAVAEAVNRVNSPIMTRKQDLAVYNVITLFDVLEHIEEPHNFLLELRESHLEDKGIVVITTPNIGCIPAYADDELRKWKHYKPREHLFLHSEQGIECLANRLRMNVLHFGTEESDIRPDNPNGDILTAVLQK